MRSKIAVLITLIGVVLVAFASSSSAAPSFTVTPTTISAGGTITVTGVECTGDRVLTRLFDPNFAWITDSWTPLGSAGEWTTTLTVPATLTPGSYIVASYCYRGTLQKQFVYGVTDVTVGPAVETPPTTVTAPPVTAPATTVSVGGNSSTTAPAVSAPTTTAAVPVSVLAETEERPTGSATELARTGITTGPWLVAGLGLIFLGTSLLCAERRARTGSRRIG
jgi:hypothetical protein